VTSAVILLNEIIVAVAISIIFLGEVMTAASSAGAIFIILAILAVSWE
jgi:drug/metabolite transporter (DMT)-like permease